MTVPRCIGRPMSKIVEYVLPVQNAQDWLEDRVLEVLDDLSEQPLEFELLIIDDGSSDETSEIAQDLELRYPQIRVLTREMPHGMEASRQLAIRSAGGRQIFMIETNQNHRAAYHRIEVPNAGPKSAGRLSIQPRVLGGWPGPARLGSRIGRKLGET